MRSYLAWFILILLSFQSSAQQFEDSLLNAIESTKDIRVKIDQYNELAGRMLDDDQYIKAKSYANKAVKLATSISDPDKLIKSKINYGSALHYNNKFEESNTVLKEVTELASENKDKESLAEAQDLMGINYMELGNYQQATTFFFKALENYEKLKNDEGMIKVWNNLGRINMRQGKLKEAADYFNKCIDRSVETGNLEHISSAYNNIAIVYYKSDKKKEAFDYLEKALEIYEETGDKRGKAACLGNIGNFYFYEGQLDKVLEYYTRSLSEYSSINDNKGVCFTLNNIGFFYAEKGNYEDAIFTIEQGLNTALEIDSKSDVVNAYEYLSHVYEKKGDTENALKNFKLYSAYRDSLINMENMNYVSELQAAYNFDQKEREIELLKKEKIAEETRKESKERQTAIITTSLFIGIILLIIIAFIIYRNNIIVRRKNGEIFNQKSQLETKNKDITDSITYARTIQNGILPSEEIFDNTFKDHFILYQPKDIVSGDFYWIEQVENNVFFCVGDCTGHGVPGAMMSVLGTNALFRSINDFALRSPAKILDKLSEILTQRFESSGHNINDGIDMALCCLDVNNMKMHYAGAYNPVWIIRNGDLMETKGDKQPVGKFESQHPFTNHTFDLIAGDQIYLLTDGIADQFGGPNGKKFKYTQLRSLLMKIRELSMKEQKDQLSSSLTKWQGTLEQVDDICVLGVKV